MTGWGSDVVAYEMETDKEVVEINNDCAKKETKQRGKNDK